MSTPNTLALPGVYTILLSLWRYHMDETRIFHKAVLLVLIMILRFLSGLSGHFFATRAFGPQTQTQTGSRTMRIPKKMGALGLLCMLQTVSASNSTAADSFSSTALRSVTDSFSSTWTPMLIVVALLLLMVCAMWWAFSSKQIPTAQKLPHVLVCVMRWAFSSNRVPAAGLYHPKITRSGGGGFAAEASPQEASVGQTSESSALFNCGGDRKLLAVAVCMYNEPAYALARTFHSLSEAHDASSMLGSDVLVLVDGVSMLSDSMRTYLQETFGFGLPLSEEDWQRHDQEHGGISRTYVLNARMTGGKGSQINLVLKRRNAKKINSHMWFFRGFAIATRYTFAMTTDVGTIFDKDCIKRLVSYMQQHEQCGAVTGRQRVMSCTQQQDPTNPEGSNLLGSWLRRAQGWEFEAEHCGGKNLASAIGYLPVLPGPCAMFRTAAIQDHPLKEVRPDVQPAVQGVLHGYFTLASMKAYEVGLLLANLLIAEDRVPSLLVVFAPPSGDGHAAQCFYSHWVHDAVFYFEAETDLKALITQRRRWNNGTFAGHCYMLTSGRKIIFASKHGMRVKTMSCVLVFMQVTKLGIIFIAPGVYGSVFWFATSYIARLLFAEAVLQTGVTTALVTMYTVGYMAIVGVHLKRFSKANDIVYNKNIWVAVALLNSFMMSILFIALMTFAARVSDCTPEAPNVTMSQEGCGDIATGSLSTFFSPMDMVYLQASLWLLPLLVALLTNIHGFVYMSWLPNWIVYQLFTPTYVGIMWAYSLARMADLNWGNRPSEEVMQELGAVGASCEVQSCCEPPHKEAARFCAHHNWLKETVRKIKVLNILVVSINVAIIYYMSSTSMIILIVFINGAGALEQAATLMLSVVALVGHLLRYILRCLRYILRCQSCRREDAKSQFKKSASKETLFVAETPGVPMHHVLALPNNDTAEKEFDFVSEQVLANNNVAGTGVSVHHVQLQLPVEHKQHLEMTALDCSQVQFGRA